MKKNWAALIWSVVAAVIMMVLTKVFFIMIESLPSDSQSANLIDKFIALYTSVSWVMAAITVLLGLWGVFKKAGCTCMLIWGILLIVLGGVLMYLISGIILIVVGTKGKNKFIKYQAEKAAEEKYAAKLNDSSNADAE